jgi:DNA end-binding protein Ku
MVTENVMPARALASATVSFGLVSIPVKLYSATESSAGISFNWLHAKCGTRVKQQYFCPKDEEIVAREDMVKGYEFSKDRYVTFTPEELKALEEEASQTIEITEFVPVSKIDPIYFDKPYFLGFDKGGEKAYRLLATAMDETGRAALGRYAARGKQYLVLLRPLGQGLVLQQLHYADEVRSFADVPTAGGAEVKEGELKLAVQLVDQISSDAFHPEAYEDEVRKRVRELIERKVEGEEITAAPPPAAQGARIIDLMDALKASLAKKPAGAAAETTGAGRKPAKRTPRSASGGGTARKKGSKTAGA